MSKIQTEILKSGDSRTFPKKGCVVRVHYEGWVGPLIPDSLWITHEPFSLPTGPNLTQAKIETNHLHSNLE